MLSKSKTDNDQASSDGSQANAASTTFGDEEYNLPRALRHLLFYTGDFWPCESSS